MQTSGPRSLGSLRSLALGQVTLSHGAILPGPTNDTDNLVRSKSISFKDSIPIIWIIPTQRKLVMPTKQVQRK